jgi:hypothetical protein
LTGESTRHNEPADIVAFIAALEESGELALRELGSASVIPPSGIKPTGPAVRIARSG